MGRQTFVHGQIPEDGSRLSQVPRVGSEGQLPLTPWQLSAKQAGGVEAQTLVQGHPANGPEWHVPSSVGSEFQWSLRPKQPLALQGPGVGPREAERCQSVVAAMARRCG